MRLKISPSKTVWIGTQTLVVVIGLSLCLSIGVSSAYAEDIAAGGEALGTRSYDDYETPDFCGSECHVSIFRQWEQSLMGQSFTHHWDEIEYYKLALPHAEKEPAVAEVKAGCIGCHAPLAFLAGDIPPERPSSGTRANESVSCDFCHTITGFKGDRPYNFNFISSPGDVKYGPRGTGEPLGHEVAKSDFLSTTEFCGTCHNEMSPFGVWVKSTQIEWAEGPYATEDVRCQDCHMPKAPGTPSEMSDNHYSDVRQHLFHGAHDKGKLRGTVELRIHPDVREAKRGDMVTLTVALFNQKAGHKFPTGSVEDRILWLHVEATDAAGTVYHLPVDPKGFGGEEYTIGADVLAYQDMGVPLGDPEFEGVQRDGIPVGDRIFRMPYFDPEGRMTIQQWNTQSLGVDYRIGPRETKIETFTFQLPDSIAPGVLRVSAVLNYQRLVAPVAAFLGVPDDETEIVVINDHETAIEIMP